MSRDNCQNNNSIVEIKAKPVDEIMSLADNKKKVNNSTELPIQSPIIKDIKSLKPKNNQVENS